MWVSEKSRQAGIWQIYVLGGFSKEDEALVKEACEHAAEAAAEILTDGPDKAMNDFN